jgi:hypothetical protein
MVAGGTKRIIVIRDIDSDIIEEAILVLKNERESSPRKDSGRGKSTMEPVNNDYLLKEARFVIDNYAKVCRITAGNTKRRRGMGIIAMLKQLPLVVLINVLLLISAVFIVVFVMKLV